MTRAIDDELDELVDEFELLGDWEERYRHLIDLGRGLAPLSDAEREETNRVRGCASQVWLVSETAPGQGLKVRGDSDSGLVRGLIALLIRLYSERQPDEIAAFDVASAFRRLGFASAISAQRSNGFFSMVERIRRDAAGMLAST
jgi:cysteine desulfuration protein SufE